MAKKPPARNQELSTRPMIRDRLLDVYKDIQSGFEDQNDRTDDILDYWDAYNQKLGERQFYSGTSQMYLPFIHDAVEARQTRFTNQLFPQAGRYVEVTTENGDIPHATMALLEHYIRGAKLRTQIVPALLRSGDAEGQMSVYVGWREVTKVMAERVEKPLKVSGADQPAMDPVKDIEQTEVTRGMPDIEVLHDTDLLVIPATANSIEEAIQVGGWVVVRRRWTKTKIKQMIKDEEIIKKEGEALIDSMAKAAKDVHKDMSKELASAAGVKAKGKFAVIYEAWGQLKVEGSLRLCRAFFGGETAILGAKLNPYWCDEVPVISGAVQKMPGVFKGVAPISWVIDLQVFANDTINEGADTAHFAAMPITMTDPEKNPKVGTMIMGLGAVWETSPNDTKFVEFPDLWKSAQDRAEAIKTQIMQTLGVNPSMVPQSTGGKNKRNQAEMATEQQVDILTTADAVINVEETILTPLLQRIAAYDHQFREDPLMIRSYGEMGLRAQMEEIGPIQMNHQYQFKWFGVEAARNAAQIQQQIAMANVIKGIPPQMYEGYKLKLAPMIMQMVEGAFGPRLAPLIFEDQTKQLSVPPDFENEMLEHGFPLEVHPMDDDIQHAQTHMQGMQQAGGDPHGTFRQHLMKHQAQMQAKAAQQQQQMQPGLPGSPGGGGQPGSAGAPHPGAQPGQPAMKGPPGMIHADQMPAAGAIGMPRKQ
jgi:hypothetical protein